MTLAVLIIILSIFALLGLTEFIHSVVYDFIFTKPKNKIIAIEVINEETALEQLKSLWFERKWFGNKDIKGIVATYDYLSPETLEICNEYLENKDIILVPTEYIKNVIDVAF